jgi:ribosomal protein L14
MLGAIATVASLASVVIMASGSPVVGRPIPAGVVNGSFMMSTGRHQLAEAGSAATTTSYNWSGYVQFGTADKTFTAVTDSFVVPTVESASQGMQYSDDWVGIGGFDFDTRSPNNNNLVQAGVETIVTDNSGGSEVSYEAWTETLPHTERALKLKVSAGDAVTVSVQEIARNKWEMTVDDLTTSLSRSRTTRYRSTGLSAEAIHERPCVLVINDGCGDLRNLAQLAQTTNVTFDPGFFSEAAPGTPPVNQPLLGPVPQAALIGITMTDATGDNTPLAMVSAPNEANSGFAVADGSNAPPVPSF